jgi:hypothetical protein
MTRALTRTNLNSSGLIRILTDLAIQESAEPANAFAEKLGLWVDFADAITLCAAHNANPAVVPNGTAGSRDSGAEGEFARVRTAFVHAITTGVTNTGTRTRIALPTPKPGAPIEDAIAFEPYRRYHLAHQRDMELAIRPLRTRARDLLAQTSLVLKQLAALDAAFDGILGERESKLLATLPSLMEKRFRELFQSNQQLHGDNPQASNPNLWTKPGGWLSRFLCELQAVMLAELDMRLQPTLGLIEAFQSEQHQSQKQQV